jgi:penicillin V acylase-like amidase (Ntn superfamily)
MSGKCRANFTGGPWSNVPPSRRLATKRIMKNTFYLVCLTVLLFVSEFPHVSACSTFCYRDSKHLLVGKNFDFYTGLGHVIINKRGMVKTSYPLPGEQSMKWKSRYGSITFNQVGREFPYGGINEKGLVVEQMYLTATEYPEADHRPGIAELQWIQYQLDNCSSIEEVLATDSLLRISRYSAPIHFLVADALGNAATIEFVKGRLLVHRAESLPVCALTNDTYPESLNYFNSTKDKDIPFRPTSFQRFARTGEMLRHFDTRRPVEYAFEILDAVKQGEFTRWSIVYDVKAFAIHIKTSVNTNARTIRIRDFDFSCRSEVVYADIDNTFNSPKDFQNYTAAENFAIIGQAFDVLSTKPEFINLIPSKEEQKVMSAYPETMDCEQRQ